MELLTLGKRASARSRHGGLDMTRNELIQTLKTIHLLCGSAQDVEPPAIEEEWGCSISTLRKIFVKQEKLEQKKKLLMWPFG